MKLNRIIEKLGIEPITKESFRIFLGSLKTMLRCSAEKNLESLMTWDAPVLPNLKKLDSDEIRFVESEILKINISIEECQIQVQKLIPQETRKKFAAYYTIQQGVYFMAAVAQEYLKRFRGGKIVLAGIHNGGDQKIGVEKIQRIWGIEPLPLSALVAYASLLHATNGRKDAIIVITGDAFKEIPEVSSPFIQSELFKADIILTNPPFTRRKYLEKSYRDYLLKIINGLWYEEYI